MQTDRNIIGYVLIKHEHKQDVLTILGWKDWPTTESAWFFEANCRVHDIFRDKKQLADWFAPITTPIV